MKDIRAKWSLIRGASSGFGVEFARVLAALGANVVLVARRSAELEKLATELEKNFGVNTVVESIDLARSGACRELKSRLDAHGLAIDILVNNAGFGPYRQTLIPPVA
jgi:short-subunit dehydrogenase